MSDDGYYAGSPYDDDEYYYDDDVGENLADDLAQHTLPSPIYHEDPAYEMMEYYSDWDYYSDDYYDDDPVLLSVDPQTGSPLKQKAKTDKSQSRGKKRKLADTKDIPDLTLDDRPTLADSVRGTVWAGPRPHSPKPYAVGEGKRIALLKNWAQIFERSSPRSILKEDESWATNLSLEDMGLRKVESHTAQAGDDGGDVEDEMGEEERAEEADDEDNVSVPASSPVDIAMDRADGLGAESEEELDVEETKSRKRQRMLPPRPTTTSANSSTRTIVEDMKRSNIAVTDDVTSENHSTSRTNKKVYPSLGTASDDVSVPAVKTKKRKASPDGDATETIADKSTASSRAKRVASSKLATAKDEKPPPLPSTARTTRSRKK